MKLFRWEIPLRRVIVSVVVVVVYLAAVVVSFNMGKAFYVYIDNNDAEDGVTLADVDGISVSVDGKEAAEYYPGDKDRLRLQGKAHTLEIERFADGSVVKKTIDISGFGDAVNVSIPMLLAGQEGAVATFKPFVAPTFEEDFVPGTVDGSEAFVAPEQNAP